MMAGNDQTRPHQHPRPAAAPQIVTPVGAMASLDPIVQSFLDRRAERGPDAPRAGEPTVRFHPARSAATCPVLIYLHVDDAGRSESFQTLADTAHVAILLQRIEPTLGLSGADAAILAHLDAMADPTLGLDAAHVALGGDDLGALAALSFASSPRLAPGAIALLIMATPVLGMADSADDAPWPPPRHIDRAQTIAAGWMLEAGWRGELPPDRLERLPPTLLITAEADPFRDGAERLARRMMGAECDLSAMRMLGTIHDFTWLPELLDARATQDAHALMARALNQHLFA